MPGQIWRAILSDLLRGKAALTPDMALRIEKAFGPAMDYRRPVAM
jgi:plasmid maintenance system antidote protein VapI